MALQDLTPQLRTRLSRMEKTVGWFVLLATALLVAGFAYYIYQLAERKGWFLTKAPYFTMVDSAAGLHVGDRVMLMGFQAGSITRLLRCRLINSTTMFMLSLFSRRRITATCGRLAL